MKRLNSAVAKAIGIALTLAMAGCTGRVTTPNLPKNNLSVGDTFSGSQSSAQDWSESDRAIEGKISDECLIAWRQALHGDVKDAMIKMRSLEQRYPNSNTVSFMKAQILDHAGNKLEAIKYYRAAAYGNELEPIHLFKLAETERIAGDTAGAITDYRKLTKISPQFLDAHIGLAKVLFKHDPKSKEAVKELEQVLKDDPSNKEATELLAKNSSPTTN